MVVSEGEKTEKHYLDQLGREFLAIVRIKVVAPGLSPLGMARKATQLKREAVSQGALKAEDTYWLLLDVDDYGSEVERAEQLAAEEGIRTVVSNPCFEVWLLCHFEFSTAAVDKRDRLAMTLDTSHLPGYKAAGKGLKGFDLMPRLGAAESNAIALERFHANTPGTERNPSTTMWALVAHLRDPSQ